VTTSGTSSLPTADDLPDQLVDRDQWVCWREQERDGKPTKVPIDPATDQYASTTDADTWTAFDDARAHAASEPIGLGFVFTDDDPIVGVDLDDCRVPATETTHDWATAIIDRLDSYTEISPSGTGYHVLVTGALPDGRNRSGDIELYETARFFTVTADHISGTPTAIHDRTDELAAIRDEHLASDTEEDGSTDDESGTTTATERDTAATAISDEDLLERARNAANGEKFQRLWRGDTSSYESQSEADMALCSLLAFWTGADEQRIDQLFRQSGLMRAKWDEVHYSDGSTYGEKTIERVVAGTDEVYDSDSDSTPKPPADGADAEHGPTRHALEARIDQLEEREADHIETIEALEAEIRELQAENERLQAELGAARTSESASNVEETGEQSDTESLWARTRQLFGSNDS